MRRASYLPTLVLTLLSGSAFADTLVTGPAASAFTVTPAASGLTSPTSVDWLPDGRMVVTEKGGNVILVDGTRDGGANQVIGTFDVDTDSEKGLLHVLVHPEFTTNRLLLFYYSASSNIGGTPLDKHRVVTVPLGQDDRLVMAEERILLRNLRGPANHDGGALAIGPDGKLYVGVGDTGCNSNKAPEPVVTGPTNYFGTCLTNANGKILRINLDGSIPDDNPLVGKQVTGCGSACNQQPLAPSVGAPPRTEIWAWGFRNPWRFWFDPRTGNLWVGDVGEITYEEIDVIPPSGGGRHYGWPWREGAKGWPVSQCRNATALPDGPAFSPAAGDCVDPQYYCLHPNQTPYTDAGAIDGDCAAIMGGVIVDSCTFPPEYRGRYFFADAARSWVAALTPTADRNDIEPGPREKIINVSGQPVDLATGPDGALYYAVIAGAGTGSIQRLAPKTPSTCPVVPDAGGLTDGGLPDASEPSTGGAPASGGGGGVASASGGRSGSSGGSAAAGDGGPTADAGTSGGGSGDDGGCGCRVVSGEGSTRAALAALGLGAIGVALVTRRRRRGAR